MKDFESGDDFVEMLVIERDASTDELVFMTQLIPVEYWSTEYNNLLLAENDGIARGVITAYTILPVLDPHIDITSYSDIFVEGIRY